MNNDFAGKYPECEKAAKLSELSQKLGEFLEWLCTRYTLASWNSGLDRWYPENPAIHQLLAEYLDIDLAKLVAEQRQILEDLRAEAVQKN